MSGRQRFLFGAGRPLLEAGGLALIYLLLTLGMTYPLVVHLRDAIPGPPWDNLVWLYDLWWTKYTVFQGHGSPLFNPLLFAPFGYDVTLSETMVANKLLIAPVLAAASPVVAYNILLILSFVLTGLATYLFVYELTGNRAAALVGGAILAFAPYRMHAMAAGWLPLISTQWLPLLFWSLERGVRRGQRRWFVLGGVLLAANVLSSWYHAYVVGPFAVLYVVLRWRPWAGRRGVISNEIMHKVEVVHQVAGHQACRPKRGYGLLHCIVTSRQPLVGLGLMLIVTGLLVAPVALPVLRGARGQMAWSLAEAEKWSASIEDLILPQIYHPLWGRQVLSARTNVPSYPWYAPGFVALGFGPLGLMALGLWRRRREGALTALLVCAVLSFILALGTTLHWDGERVYIAVPEGVARVFARGMRFVMERLAVNPASYAVIQRPGAIPVPLPGLAVFLFLPFASALRTMYRFGLITTFSVAVLAGYGVTVLEGFVVRRLLRELPSPQPSPLQGEGGRRGPSPRRGEGRVRGGIALALVILVCFEFAVAPLGYGYTRIVEQPLDRWFASLPSGTCLAQFPLARALNGSSLYRSTTHLQPTAYGHGTFYPAAFVAAQPILDRFPSHETLDLLRTWGVRYVAVGTGAYDAGWGDQRGQTWEVVATQIERSGRLRPVYAVQELPVWEGERVSDLIRGNLPVVPIVTDRVQVYELE